MESNAFVTGADRGLGLAACAELLKRGWKVYAGQHMPEWPELEKLKESASGRLLIIPLEVSSSASTQAAARQVAASTGSLDLLINNAGVTSPSTPRTLRENLDYPEMQRMFDINSLGPLRVVEAFLPLTERSPLKRLCFVSSEAGSISRQKRDGWYGYCMSKSALNMSVRIMFNHLRPAGYSFRLYHPGWMRTYMHGQKQMEADIEPEYAASRAVSFFLRKRNEDRLVLVDYQGHVWPW